MAKGAGVSAEKVVNDIWRETRRRFPTARAAQSWSGYRGSIIGTRTQPIQAVGGRPQAYRVASIGPPRQRMETRVDSFDSPAGAGRRMVAPEESPPGASVGERMRWVIRTGLLPWLLTSVAAAEPVRPLDFVRGDPRIAAGKRER